MNKDNEKRQTIDNKTKPEMSEAEIDENLKGSFPASDPPSWTLGTKHRTPAENQERTEDESVSILEAERKINSDKTDEKAEDER